MLVFKTFDFTFFLMFSENWRVQFLPPLQKARFLPGFSHYSHSNSHFFLKIHALKGMASDPGFENHCIIQLKFHALKGMVSAPQLKIIL